MRHDRAPRQQSGAATRRELLRQLQSLDVEPCDCPLEVVEDEDGNRHFLPCEHVRRAPDHGLTLAQWADALAEMDPAGHGDPPPADRPTRATQQHALVEVYARRVAAGRAVFRKDDVRVEDLERLGRQGLDRAGNGSDYAAGCAVNGGTE